MDDDDHPLLVELDSLRQTAARFQHEAHAAAIKLQRHTLEASRTHEHAVALEQENARLAQEVAVLRAHTDVAQHPAVAQVHELSLALRRVSDKLSLTEDALLERTTELTHTRTELSRTRHAADGAYELAARMRAREEASKARERELEFKAHASEAERKMVDRVVQEYADLVRNLEGRKSAHNTPSTPNGSTNLVDTLQDGKFKLHGMLTAFSTESKNLHDTIAELNAKVSNLQVTLDTERTTASHDRMQLAQTKTELDKLNLEDQTAAKMVARYMTFSQASTNVLQEQITTLKTRHASTISTLELQLSVIETQLANERARTIRLQDALDELCEDLARESYGRRREVSLRLALLSREEGVAEFMRRWARRARELYTRCYDSAQPPLPADTVQEAFHRVVSDADSLLSTLDNDMYFSDATRTSGSMARIALSMAAVDALRSELQDEMHKRVEAVRKCAFAFSNGHSDGTKDPSQLGDIASQSGGGTPDQLPLTPNSSTKPKHEIPLMGSVRPQDADSPMAIVGGPKQAIEDPFVVSTPITPLVAEIIEDVIIQEELSPPLQDSAVTSATLLVEEEPKAAQPRSPAVSMLDLHEDLHPSPITDVAPIPALPSVISSDAEVLAEEEPKAVQSIPSLPEDHQPTCKEEHPTTDVIPIIPLSSDISVTYVQVLANEDTNVPPKSIATPAPVTSRTAANPPPPIDPPTLLTELGATKHRYDALQRAFRDCSLALKELKRTLASSSPSPSQTKFRQHLETALARIDDYAEDARVELEIRVADEELTLRGFEMVLSVPGAFADVDERTEMEASAKAFVDGTDEGVARALDKFGKKLEDVQHDVAVVKRAVHGLAMSEGEDGDVLGEDDVAESKYTAVSTGTGTGWSAWTAGLLGANTSPTRSPTPVETFGAVMTSPRVRHAASLKQPHAPEGTPDRGPLAGLGLRIPMPLPPVSPVHPSWTHLGVGHPAEGGTRPKTLSAMYAVGGLRSSSVGLGVGLGGGSPSPARTRAATGLGMGMVMVMVSAPSPLRARVGVDDTPGTDLGGVE